MARPISTSYSDEEKHSIGKVRIQLERVPPDGSAKITATHPDGRVLTRTMTRKEWYGHRDLHDAAAPLIERLQAHG